MVVSGLRDRSDSTFW
jgi:Uncharacterized conserved protein